MPFTSTFPTLRYGLKCSLYMAFIRLIWLYIEIFLCMLFLFVHYYLTVDVKGMNVMLIVQYLSFVSRALFL